MTRVEYIQLLENMTLQRLFQKFHIKYCMTLAVI